MAGEMGDRLSYLDNLLTKEKNKKPTVSSRTSGYQIFQAGGCSVGFGKET